MSLFKNFTNEINKLFKQSSLNGLTRQSEFIQRFRKISAVSLLESVLFSAEDPSKVSLNDMAIYHQLNYGISVTRQGLAKKFSKKSTTFLKLLLEQLLTSKISEGFGGFCNAPFKRILVKDSTCNQLPDNLKDHYPGSGGSGGDAAVRIQFEYNLKNLEVMDLEVTAFNQQDIANAKSTLNLIREDDLVIRDLGYTCIQTLKGIEKQKAWYISRLNYATLVRFQDTKEPLEFTKIEGYMKSNNINTIDKEVLISQGEYASRLVIELVPDKVKEERLRKAAYQSQKKGRKLSKEKKARAGLNLFITNCPKSMLSSYELRRCYGIRWQIELIFKAWKQNSQLHKVKKISIDRYEFLIYAKLIWIMLNWKVYQLLDIETFRKIRKRISILKFFKTVRMMKAYLINIIRGEKGAIQSLLNKLMKIGGPNLLHDDRKDRINWKTVENI